MKRRSKIRHEFVEFIPKDREEGVLYISIPYATAVHNCFCGCCTKVVTPISPVGWRLTYDGEAVTLWPSVGNWAFKCRSHYIIKDGRVVWGANMSEDEIAWGRRRDRAARRSYFDGRTDLESDAGAKPRKHRTRAFWSWLGGAK